MTKSNKQFKCDINLISGWYRFHGQAGQQMPTSCVKINHCGANAPGWINGTHPPVADGASTVQVCFNWVHNCCRWSTYIRVRNCSGFYVYELKKTPGCRLRYCGNGTQGTVEKSNKSINNIYFTKNVFADFPFGIIATSRSNHKFWFIFSFKFVITFVYVICLRQCPVL